MSITLPLFRRSPSVLPGLPVPVDGRLAVFGQLALGATGLVALLPFSAVRGGSSPAEAWLVLGLLAPLGVAAARAWTARAEWVYAIAALGVAALVVCGFSGSPVGAWPLAIWLVAQPLNAWLSGSRNAALAAGMISAAAAWFVAAGFAVAPLPFQPGHAGALAGAFLIASALTEGAVGILGRRETARPAAATAAADGAGDDLASLAGGLVTWHDRSGDVLRSGGESGWIGAERRPVLGGGLFERVHIPDRPAYLKALSDAATSGAPVSAAFRVMVPEEGPAGARLVPVAMTARAAATGAAVVAVIRDVSALRRHQDDLEAVRAEAAQASEMQARFLATVSHELRTPLNAIIGFSELLSADHPFVMAEDRRREYATIIRESGTHLLEVVNTLLDVSKIETGNFPFATEAFSLGALATSCCDLMGLKAEQASVRLGCRVEEDLPEIVADRRACRQILINLVSNALKFTPAEGRVTVRIGRDGGRLTIAVADTGIGIREADLPRLGDPFFQAGDMHRRPHEGTGLGLSVVRGLVGLHGGAMAIESGPGLGTTVTVALPLDPGPDATAGRPVPVHCTIRYPAPAVQRKIA